MFMGRRNSSPSISPGWMGGGFSSLSCRLAFHGLPSIRESLTPATETKFSKSRRGMGCTLGNTSTEDISKRRQEKSGGLFQLPSYFVPGFYRYMSMKLALETFAIGQMASKHPQYFQISSNIATCPHSLCHSHFTLENISGRKSYSPFDNGSEEVVI